jgi:hypothetical protein
MLVLPQSGKKLGEESLPLPYSVSLFSLLGLILVMGVGVSYVLGAIVLPAMPATYLTVLNGGLYNVTTGVGSFVTYPYWVAAVLIFLVGAYVAQRKGGVVKSPYLSGENVAGNPEVFSTTADTQTPIVVSGLYMDNEFSNTSVLSYGVIAGAILVVIMFLSVVL